MPTINGRACVANGRNLYTDTKNFDNLASWHNSSYWKKTTDTYKELAVMQTTAVWHGLSQYVQVKKGDVLTYSAYAKYISGTGNSAIFWGLSSQTEGSYSTATPNPANNDVTITDSWQRVSGTVVATSDGYLRPRLERGAGNTNTLQIAGIKLEKGSVATLLTPAPVDKVFSNGRQVYGRNLASGTNQEYAMGVGIPNTTWKDGYAYLKLPTTIYHDGEILPQGPHVFLYILTQGTTYTQTIWFETDATVKYLSAAKFTWFTYRAGHDIQPTIVQNLGQNSYKLVSTYTWPGKTDNKLRLFDIYYLDSAFDLSTGTYLKFGKLKLEEGSVATPWTPAPEDVM